jgi:hypothetical protein
MPPITLVARGAHHDWRAGIDLRRPEGVIGLPQGLHSVVVGLYREIAAQQASFLIFACRAKMAIIVQS